MAIQIMPPARYVIANPPWATVVEGTLKMKLSGELLVAHFLEVGARLHYRLAEQFECGGGLC